MSLSYVDTGVAADVSAIRARLRVEWRHRAVVRVYRVLNLLSFTPSQPANDTYLLPILGLSCGVILGLWIN